MRSNRFVASTRACCGSSACWLVMFSTQMTQAMTPAPPGGGGRGGWGGTGIDFSKGLSESRGMIIAGLVGLAVAASAGALFIRSFERGERVHMAMLARGYDGTMPPPADDRAGSTRRWVAYVVPGVAALVAAISWWLA